MNKYRDIGEEETQKLLEEIEKEVEEHYSTAKRELEEKLEKFTEKFEKKNEEMLKRVSEGSMSTEDYDKWRKGQLTQSDWIKDMKDVIAEDLTNSNQIAMSIVNGYTPDVYALNMNFTTYSIESQANINTLFTLYNAETVENLIRKKPDLLPKAKVNVSKDLRWNKKAINSAIIQGTLQGEGIRQITKRLMRVTDMNKNVATRNARTMVTAAQNMGREDSIKRAQDMGIDVERVWVATLDFRTRHSHRHLDGEVRAVGEPFSNGLMFPGDPDGVPAEVYNCRCREIATVYGLNPLLYATNRQNKLGDMSYEEWKAGRSPEPPTTSAKQSAVVDGKDISATWQRRPDKFDFEIEDVINAQGFDGLPRVLSKEEFDKAVQESSFIAQRTYTAPSQEILDEYRNQLYNGKWYVDCGTGGAQYGQGMYCAADYNGKITEGVKREMRHYQSLGEQRFGEISLDDAGTILAKRSERQNEILRRFKAGEISKEDGIRMYNELSKMMPQEYLARYMKDSTIKGARAYTETLTLDKSARIIKYNELRQMQDNAYKYLAEDYISKSSFREASEYWAGQTGNYFNSYLSEKNEEAFYSLPKEEKRKIQKDFDDILEKASKAKTMDSGSFATLMGYDAINAEGHGDSGSYTVILNRTKVIILGE